MPTLSATGNTPIAYKLLLNDTFPSWGYSIKHGATTIWERWDGWTAEHGFQDPGMNSFAHYSFGAVARWMFQTVAGIDMAEPGFQRLLIHPQPAEGLTWVKASYGSIHGRIATQWKTADGKLAVIVSIPANTTATVVLPTTDPAAVTENGKPLEQAEGVKVLGSSAARSAWKSAPASIISSCRGTKSRSAAPRREGALMERPDVPKIVEAEEFVVRDKNGVVRARLGATVGGAVLLSERPRGCPAHIHRTAE